MSIKSERAWLFKRQRKSAAKTIRGKLNALLKLYDKPDVYLARGTFTETPFKGSLETGYCLQGAMIALGFKEDNGRPFLNSQDDLSRCILKAAKAKGYQYNTIWKLNDGLPKAKVYEILEHAIELAKDSDEC